MANERAELFEALRAYAPGGSIPPGDIPVIDDLADRWGIAPDGGCAPGVVVDRFPISAIDALLLKMAAPARPLAELEAWVEPIKAACRRYDINNIRRVAAFVTTLGHEGGFVVGKRENMNYSAVRMSEVWPGRFAQGGVKGRPNALAKALDRKPEDIANHVYANRMGNGAPASGDGWRFRGNGPPQLTGRDNHEAFAKAMNMTLDQAMAYIATLDGGVMAAAWFWEENDVNRLADTPGVSDETKRINGGEIGLAARRAIFDTLVAELLRREP